MSDLPWEIKKGAGKEPPEDTPPTVEFPWEKDKSTEGGEEPPVSRGVPDIFAGAFDDIPMEEVSDSEIPSPPNPSEMPSLDEMPDFLKSAPIDEETAAITPPEPSLQPPSFPNMPDFGGESAPPFKIEPPLIEVNETDVEKPPEPPVIDGLSEGMQGDVSNEEDEIIPSFDNVFGLKKNQEGKTDLPKPSPPPLFEPKFSRDEDMDVDGSIELPIKAPIFEVYGQEHPETASPFPPESVSDSPSPFPPESVSDSPSPFPPASVSDSPSPFPPESVSVSDSPSPFPPESVSDSPSPFPPASVSDPPSPFPPTPDAQIPTQPSEVASLTNNNGKKTVDGIVASIKNMLKGLTRGGSLIDRMEELREEVEIAEEEHIRERSGVEPTPSISPFETVPEMVEPKEMVQTIPVLELDETLIKQKEPEAAVAKGDMQERVVTEPVAELDKNEMQSLVGGLSRSEIQLLVGEQVKDALGDHIVETPAESVSDMVVDMDGLRDELADSKALINGLVNDIKELSSTVENSTSSMSDIKRCAEDFDSEVSIGFDSAREKISVIENRLDVVENALTLIQSDNAEVKVGLSGIEQNISELVGSYSALLSQIHESTQNNDVRFEELSHKVDRIDAIDSNISNIENNQVVTAETIAELGNTTSVLMGDIAEVYEANESMKDELQSGNASLRDEMASVTDYVEKGLKKVGAGSYKLFGEDVQLTYLEKNSSTMKLCMEWIEFLMELVGRNNLPDILSYYEELGWISDDIRLEVMRYAEGIDYYIEKPDWKLNPDEHVKSIWFIEKLAGVKVDKNRLSIIERDIERVKKGTEIYGI